MANSPLNHNTLASVKTWGIQQELVICRCKGMKLFMLLQVVFKKSGFQAGCIIFCTAINNKQI
ncbi:MULTISPECIES: hypothetical protein [Emticicia]|uniref:hypothetical protein n=1 Tax=Emticicia TaxID=312278 RepID=UPI0020A1351F|nr:MULTISPECIES: hypothetical protein [Emticicia]UTA69512.1 hypothetical protein MB380_06795 [Emticicia sp. 21SJ11W-3]